MSEQEIRHFIYLFEAVRPELITDPDAWTEEDVRIFEDRYGLGNELSSAIEALSVEDLNPISPGSRLKRTAPGSR